MRKEVGNPIDFFDKAFDEYKEGFSANGLLASQDALEVMWVSESLTNR